MLEFIQLLKQRYQTVRAQLDKKSPQYFEYQQRAEQLLYGEAFIRKGLLIAEMPQFPLQIAVIGPTQAGKSSVVNLLLNNSMAGVSPLAGYTVHPHGFCHQWAVDDCAGLQHYFGRFQCLDAAQLSHSRYDCFSLQQSATASPLLPNCVLWDTPDFDSIDALDYREGVIRTLALADVIVLVVSKEKYADQSVWEVMKIIEAFQQPTLICLNKLSEDSENLVVESLRQKWRQTRRDEPPPVVSLFFQKLPELPRWPASAQRAVVELSKKVAHKKQPIYQQQLLHQYWPQWLAPVLAEHHAQQHWQTLVDQCLSQAAKDYRRDYLDHPHHYQTFQNALLNLLNLLEIPGMARVLGKTRRMMTWPLRKLMTLGRQYAASPIQELTVLSQIGEHLLIQLADKLLEKSESETSNHPWWQATAATLRQRRGELLQHYQQATQTYHHDFQQDVDAAAHRLYYKLQEQPVVLNSLRATRITTDAGAMLLAIQTGGIGLHDLLLTPLMLTITSLLAESALGSYMQRVEAELKQHQFNTVQNTLFDASLRQNLYRIPAQCAVTNRFNISPEQLKMAEHALKEKKHGLRLL